MIGSFLVASRFIFMWYSLVFFCQVVLMCWGIWAKNRITDDDKDVRIQCTAGKRSGVENIDKIYLNTDENMAQILSSILTHIDEPRFNSIQTMYIQWNRPDAKA